MTHLSATDLTFDHGPVTTLAGASLRVSPGMRVGVTGPNGCGKTTLLRLLAGELVPRSGNIDLQPADALVGLVAQEPLRWRDESILENLARRTGVSSAERDLELATSGYDNSSTGPDDYSRALDRWTAVGAADFESRAESILQEVGLGRRNAHSLRVEWLSGGELARLELATVLLHRATLLLLDEPTNNLDGPGLARLERLIGEPRRSIVVVSHDRAFLERVVTDVVEIDGHTRRTTFHSGGWLRYEAERSAIRHRAAQRHADFLEAQSRLQDQVQRERHWADRGASAVRKSQEPDKSIKAERLASAERRGTAARRTNDRLERLEVVPKPFESWELKFTLAQAERGSSVVFEARDLIICRGSFSLGPLNMTIRAGDRTLLSGDNGAGKSTLVETILGEHSPDSGTRVLGASVITGSLSQERDRYNADQSLLDRFCELTGCDPEPARSVLAKFGLGAGHVERSGRELSAGERTRAVLAEFQLRGVNFLVLDEPTNHLDIEAIEQLETALRPFGGTLLIVTHDERFRETIQFDRELRLEHGALV